MRDFDILLIEDSTADAMLFKRALKHSDPDLKIHWIADGRDAIDFFFKKDEPAFLKTPRLIFLDIKLPRVNGLEILRKLKSDKATREIPVIMLSSSNQEKDIVLANEYGVNSYVVKPERYNELKNMTNTATAFWLKYNELSNK